MFTITIDGPSSSGKSTVADLVAKKLNFHHLNSGNFYRVIAMHLLEKGITPGMPISDDLLDDIDIDVTFDGEKQYNYLNKKNVTDLLHSNIINENVSRFAKNDNIIIKASQLTYLPTQNYNLVIDGRNVGSFVLPMAELKIYLDCDPKVRAERRYKEMLEKGEKVNFDDILRQTIERDTLDKTRPLAPLVCPKDAYVLDSSYMTAEEVADKVVEIYNKIK